MQYGPPTRPKFQPKALLPWSSLTIAIETSRHAECSVLRQQYFSILSYTGVLSIIEKYMRILLFSSRVSGLQVAANTLGSGLKLAICIEAGTPFVIVWSVTERGSVSSNLVPASVLESLPVEDGLLSPFRRLRHSAYGCVLSIML